MKPVETQPEVKHLPLRLQPFARKIAGSKLPHVDVVPVIGPTLQWNSKLRGVPYYHKDWPWPLDVEGKPLVMLVQINFSEMPALANYPTEGLLQLYVSADYVPERQMWGMRSDNAHGTNRERLTDQSFFRALYFPRVSHDVEELITATPAVAFDDDYSFPALDEALLTFTEGSSYVRPEDYRFRRFFGQDGFEFLYGLNRDLHDVQAYEEFMGGRRYVARIGGYSRVEQRDPRLEFPDEDWVLLFSLDSEGDSDYIVGWGGGGIGNFYIRPEDLTRRDFSRVMYYWDFG
jgi:uncharacterized protein YwqG